MSLMAAAVVVALSVIFGMLTVTAEREATDRALQERVFLAQLAAGQMDYMLDTVQTSLDAIAAPSADGSGAPRSDVLRQATLRPNSPFRQLWLTDRTGSVIAAALPMTGELSFSNVIQPLQSDIFTVTGADLPGLGRMVIAAVPAHDTTGKVTGALVARLNMTDSEIYSVIRSVNLGQTGYLEVVGQDGLVILSTQPQRRWEQADHGATLSSLILSGQSIATTCHDCHEASPAGIDRRLDVMAFAPMKRASWGVVIRQAQEEAFAPSRQLQMRIIFLGILALAGVTLLVWLSTRSFIRPVETLMTAARRIAGGDLETPVTARSSDEIGALAGTLDDMRARLRDSMAEIQTLNRDLDRRVQERTQECMMVQVALRRSHDDLQSIIDGLDDVLLVIGPDQRVRLANQSARRHYRRTGQIIGRPCYEVSHFPEPCRPPNCQCPLPTVLATGQTVRVTHYHADGGSRERYVEVVASPLRDEDDRVKAIIELMYDVTDERQLRETLVRRNRELSALNAVVMAATRPLHLDELLVTALDEVLRVTGVDVGSVFLLREESGELVLQAQRGTSEVAAQAMIRLHLDDSACGGVAGKDHPVVVPDLSRSRSGAGLVLRQAGICSLVHVPLISRGMTLGTLCVGTQRPRDFQPEEVDLLMAIGSQIAVGIENARLYEELAYREQLRGELLEKVITAQEEERKRIARDLHDDTSQSLSALIYSLEAVETRCGDSDVRPSLVSMRQRVTQILEGVHKLIFDLRPSMLDHLGLFVALRWYAETHLEPAGIRLHLEEHGTLRRLPPQMETALFRVVQEAVNNVVRHSGARNVRMTFDCRNDVVGIDVEDDGIGFDWAEVSRTTDQQRGLGLVGMQERVGLLGGQIAITSTRGEGTQVSIRVSVEPVK